MGELLKSGCTTSSDHHYVFPAGCGLDLIDAQFAAADKLGMRFNATRGSMDLSEKDGGLPPDSVVQTVDEILKDSEEAVRKYHDPAPYAMHRVSLAPCSPFSVSRELLAESAKLARALGVRLHTHLAETKDEERYMLTWNRSDGSGMMCGMRMGFILMTMSWRFWPKPEPAWLIAPSPI